MQNTDSPAHFEVLLVDDNRDELDTAEATLAEANLPINLRIAKAGETLALLRQEGDFHGTPRPHLILPAPPSSTAPLMGPRVPSRRDSTPSWLPRAQAWVGPPVPSGHL